SICLYVLIVETVLTAVGPTNLIGYSGTILTPLGAVGGPAVAVLGALYAVLSLGLASVHSSLTLYNLVAERVSRRVRGSFWIRVMPVLAVFAVMVGMVLLNTGSFAGGLNFLGAFTLPLLAGILPTLLVACSRRRGDLAVDRAVRFVGHPLVVTL